MPTIFKEYLFKRDPNADYDNMSQVQLVETAIHNALVCVTFSVDNVVEDDPDDSLAVITSLETVAAYRMKYPNALKKRGLPQQTTGTITELWTNALIPELCKYFITAELNAMVHVVAEQHS